MQTGMEAFSIDPEELAGTLQRRFQSSASVTKLPGKTETGTNVVSAVWYEQYGLSSDAKLQDASCVATFIYHINTGMQTLVHHSVRSVHAPALDGRSIGRVD
jgi:hypothetical protein